MARTLSATLEAQQKYGLITQPYLIAKIRRKWGGVIRYDWVNLYSGAEEDAPHCATIPSDGSLIRFRINDYATTKDLYWSRIAVPEAGSDFSSWNTFFFTYVNAIACCSLGAEVSIFVALTTGHIYQRISTDYGANWGDPVKIIDYWAGDCIGMDAAYKPNGDIALTFLAPSVLREYSDDVSGGNFALHELLQYCEAWTPNLDEMLDSVELLLYRTQEPGTAYLTIYEADVNGKPTGAALTSTSFNANLLTADTAGEYKTLVVPPIAIDQAKEYVLVLRASDAVPPAYLNWKYGTPNPLWGMIASYSDDGGITWHNLANQSGAFKINAYKGSTASPHLNLYKQPSGGSWAISATIAPTISDATGVSIVYSEDWNLIVAYGGASVLKGIKAGIYGDGTQQASETWSAWTKLLERLSSEPFTYKAPFIRRPDTTRLLFVEEFTEAETQERLYYSHTPPAADFADYAWLEPVPLDYESEYGLCLSMLGSYAWLTNAKTVYRALATDDELDITSKLLQLDIKQMPDIQKGSVKITIDNTNGAYNTFARLGDEVTIGIGYKTPAGNEYSLTSSFWITKYRLESPPWYPLRMIFPPGIIGTLVIEAHDAWDFLKRYKTRRPYTWAAEEKSVTELLQFFLGRSGLDFEILSQSSAALNFKPAFVIARSTTYRTIVKNLLKMIPDQLIFREAKAILRNPTTAEAVDWIYNNLLGPNNLVYRGRYGTSAYDPNRAEVWGDTFMKMEANYPQIQKMRDRLSRVTTPTYPDITRAGERALSDLRKAEILTGEESWMAAPVNCGLEPWDKLQITDSVGGVTNIYRRVIRMTTHWNAKHWEYQQIINLGAD